MITIKLPYPPTLNMYWRHAVKNRKPVVYISAQGKAYRTEVFYRCRQQLSAITALKGRLEVTMNVSTPDRRPRDLDNLPKALLDALTHAGVWHDDSQIDRLVVQRMAPVKGGEVNLTIQEIRQ